MVVFAIIALLPIWAYCIVQSVRDAVRKNWPMVIWGVAMAALLTWMVLQLSANPGY